MLSYLLSFLTSKEVLDVLNSAITFRTVIKIEAALLDVANNVRINVLGGLYTCLLVLENTLGLNFVRFQQKTLLATFEFFAHSCINVTRNNATCNRNSEN